MVMNPITSELEDRVRVSSVGNLPVDRRVIRAEYNFNVSGGAIGTILIPGAWLPKGSIVYPGQCSIEVATIPVGASATISAGIEAAADLQAAAAIAGAPWSTLGVKTPSATAFFKTTVARQVQIVIATTPLSAGRIIITVSYDVNG